MSRSAVFTNASKDASSEGFASFLKSFELRDDLVEFHSPNDAEIALPCLRARISLAFWTSSIACFGRFWIGFGPSRVRGAFQFRSNLVEHWVASFPGYFR